MSFGPPHAHVHSHRVIQLSDMQCTLHVHSSHRVIQLSEC
jgi:hypothetical protein